MHGNVWEWVADHWHDTYDGDKPGDARPGIETGAKNVKRLHRVVRGGCYKSLPQHLRSAHRAHRRPRMRSPTIGFRLARELVPKSIRHLLGRRAAHL
jgi:eukaryotic-like serine/threonine-protein kinase